MTSGRWNRFSSTKASMPENWRWICKDTRFCVRDCSGNPFLGKWCSLRSHHFPKKDWSGKPDLNEGMESRRKTRRHDRVKDTPKLRHRSFSKWVLVRNNFCLSLSSYKTWGWLVSTARSMGKIACREPWRDLFNPLSQNFNWRPRVCSCSLIRITVGFSALPKIVRR